MPKKKKNTCTYYYAVNSIIKLDIWFYSKEFVVVSKEGRCAKVQRSKEIAILQYTGNRIPLWLYCKH